MGNRITDWLLEMFQNGLGAERVRVGRSLSLEESDSWRSRTPKTGVMRELFGVRPRRVADLPLFPFDGPTGTF
jgi:hypothetical protein